MKANLLKEALAKAKPFAARKSTLPILQNVALRSERDLLWMWATNLEIACCLPVGYMQHMYQCPDLSPVTVSHAALSGVLQGWSGEDIWLSTEGGKLKVYANGQSILLPTIPYEDFPNISIGGTLEVGILSASFLSEVAARVAPSAHKSNGERPVLENVMAQIQGRDALFVAADGYELATLRCGNGSVPPPDALQFLVPASAFKSLAGLAAGPNEKIVLTADPSEDKLTAGIPMTLCLRYTTTGATASVRLYNLMLNGGNYPNWRQTVPESNPKVAFGPAKPIVQALKLLRPITAEHPSHASHWKLDGQGATVTAKQVEMGEGSQSLPLVVLQGCESFSWDLERAMGLISRAGDTVAFHLGGRLSPALLEGDGGWKAVLMPLNLDM